MKTITRLLVTFLSLIGIVITREDGERQWVLSHKGTWIPVMAGGAGGDSDTGALADSLPSLRHSARIVREQLGQNFVSAVERRPLPMGTGRSWNEIDLAKINAQAVPEGSTHDNPQQLADTLFSIEPTRIGTHIIITAEAAHYVSQNVASEWGKLLQNSIQRLKDRTGLNLYDGATVTGGGTTTTLNSGVVSAMVAQIQGDTDESALDTEEIFFFAHGFQLHDVRTELTAGVGTYPLPAGMTAEAFAQGARVIEKIGGAIVRRDNNIRIDGTPDAHGGVHARSGVVLVEVTGKKRDFTEMPGNRGGDTLMWLYDWFGYGERSAGNLLKRVLTDATAPTAG